MWRKCPRQIKSFSMSNPSPRIFISFDYDNNLAHKILFAGQTKNSRIPFNISDWSSKEELPQSQWEKRVSDKILLCHALLILVGKNTANAIGVKKEIAMATRHNVPFFGVYVDDANVQTALPLGLARNRVILWNWENIASAIVQVTKEGKNI